MDAYLDTYRIELPRGLRTYRDRFPTPYPGRTWIIPRRVPPTWIALVSEAALGHIMQIWDAQ